MKSAHENAVIENVSNTVDEIALKVEKVAETENLILKKIKEEYKEEKKIEVVEEEIKDANVIQKALIEKMRHYKLLYPLVITIGIVLVWRGLWGIFDQAPIVSIYVISLLLGFIILWAFNRVKNL